MQKTFLLSLLLPLALTHCTQTEFSPEEQAWQQCDSILRVLATTDFSQRQTYSITDFGALAVVDGRDTLLCHDAINAAILAASQAGGGTVIIPDSTYVTGPITLMSNVNLHLSDKAILKFSTRQELYFPAVLTRWEGCDCYNAHPLIYAHGAENIALTGHGTLDAQSSIDNWWAMSGARHYGWSEGKVSQAGRDHVRATSPRQRLLDWCTNLVPVEQRQFTAEDGMRPQFVNFVSCQRVLIEDVTLLRSPFWVLHPLLCDDVIVRGVRVINEGPNGDGCDPECCNRVLIEDCVFHTGDDCIAIKSGRNQDGRLRGIPSQNIVVRRCSMEDGHGGVVIGSEIGGGHRNLWVERCRMDSPNLERVIRIKTNSLRGGVVENVWVRDVTVGRCREAVLRINLDYEPHEVGERGHNPTVRNVNLRNVTCQESRYAVVLNGLADCCNIYDINVSDCAWSGIQGGPKGALCDGLIWAEGHYRDVHFDNLLLNGQSVASLEDQLLP